MCSMVSGSKLHIGHTGKSDRMSGLWSDPMAGRATTSAAGYVILHSMDRLVFCVVYVLISIGCCGKR